MPIDVNQLWRQQAEINRGLNMARHEQDLSMRLTQLEGRVEQILGEQEQREEFLRAQQVNAPIMLRANKLVTREQYDRLLEDHKMLVDKIRDCLGYRNVKHCIESIKLEVFRAKEGLKKLETQEKEK